MLKAVREVAGVLAFDWPRYRRALATRGDYLAICNRNERLVRAPQSEGYMCDWRWTSELHAPKVLPTLGAQLMARALAQHPIRRAAERDTGGDPAISFIIGHRGAGRVPHLLATLSSIAGQTAHAPVECVVVEQDEAPHLAGVLPAWVGHVHQRSAKGQPYSRSWAFNAGARVARAPLLVFHDNDMLLPADYAGEALRIAAAGWEVQNLKRFIFYMPAQETQAICAGGRDPAGLTPELVVQNLEGGGSVVITRSAFESIGGFNEAFVGWGGEDVEFWERAATRKSWAYAHLPLVHLWHPPQPGKRDPQAEPMRLYHRLASIAPGMRIERLRAMPRGSIDAPNADHALG